MKSLLAGLAAVLVLLLAGCGGGAESAPDLAPADESTTEAEVELDPELRDELVAMMDEDQRQRMGEDTLNGDYERTERLKEIIAEHGWPTWDLVGKKGEEAAWVIAQHSDLDQEFQAEALERLRGAVEADQASPGNLAYLEDRVLAGKGEPLVYGTQMGCTRKGKVIEPPIQDPDGLDERREAAGLPPYEDYLEEMAEGCATW